MARLILAGMAIVISMTAVVLPPGWVGPRTRTVRPARTDGIRAVHPMAQADGRLLAFASGQPAGGAAQGDAAARPEFKAAGVCARCHVVSVLEWGISKHVAEATSCRDCHGPSKGTWPTNATKSNPTTCPAECRLPTRACAATRRAAPRRSSRCPARSATTSMPCSIRPGGRRLRTTTCANCSPGSRRSAGTWTGVKPGWSKGTGRGPAGCFEDALALMPGDRRVVVRLGLCKRRLEPAVPGFTIVGTAFDAGTGLPKDVKVVELDLPMVLVPPGEFDLGTEDLAASQPVHTVAVGPFYLGKFEVTQAQWRAVMGSNPSVHQGQRFGDTGTMPVEHVSWEDCQEFL